MEYHVPGPSNAPVKRRMYFVLVYCGEEQTLQAKLSDGFVTLRMVSNLKFISNK